MYLGKSSIYVSNQVLLVTVNTHLLSYQLPLEILYSIDNTSKKGRVNTVGYLLKSEHILGPGWRSGLIGEHILTRYVAYILQCAECVSVVVVMVRLHPDCKRVHFKGTFSDMKLHVFT